MLNATGIELKHNKITHFFLPHGQRAAYIEGNLKHIFRSTYCVNFKINDKIHSAISEVPFTIIVHHDEIPDERYL